jgi:Protein of unknown function (DUF1207)
MSHPCGENIAFIRLAVRLLFGLAGLCFCVSGSADEVRLTNFDRVEPYRNVLSITENADRVFQDVELDCNTIRASKGGTSSQESGCHFLPDGLLWHSYWAAPHEPRMSLLLFGDDQDGIFWDATLGGRVGLLRYGTPGTIRPEGWQLDLEGAVMTRLDLNNSEDVESMDYRFGIEMTRAIGAWASKFGYFHISSHVGDEYLVRNPTYERVNYVTESLILGVSNRSTESVRTYIESAFAFKTSGGAKPWQFQLGAEYMPSHPRTTIGVPFAAVNLDIREVVDFDPTSVLQAGWAWRGPKSDRMLRTGLQYGNGYSSQFSFVERKEHYLGVGLWFDY